MFFNQEIAYLYLISEGSKVQIKKLIETITQPQLSLLQTGTRLIRQGTVNISSFEFEQLQENLTFVRAFSEIELSPRQLRENATTLALIAQIIVRNYETCSESGAGSQGGMGQNQGQREDGRRVGNCYQTQSSSSSNSSSNNGGDTNSGEEDEETTGSGVTTPTSSGDSESFTEEVDDSQQQE